MTTTSSPGRKIQRHRIQITDQLLMSVFEPASVFGAPVRGRVSDLLWYLCPRLS